jgi:hypothetical protein
MAEGNIAGQWSISSLQNAEEIIVALLETAPNDQAQTILTGLKDEKLLFPFFKNVDGENFNKLITRLTDFVLASYSRPTPFDLQTAIANNRYIHFNDNWLGTINKEQILSTGQFYVSTPKFITGSNALYSIIASPYEYILTTFENDFGVGDDKFLKGESYVLPAMYVYLLFNQDTKQAYKTSGKIALMTGLTLLGVGEIAAAIETGSVTGFVVGSIDVGLGVGDIVLNEVFKNEIIDKYGDEGKDFIETWQKISMVWGVGRIAQTALNGTLTIAVNKAKNALKTFKSSSKFGSLSTDTQKLLNDVDNKLIQAEGKIKIQDKEGNYAEFADDIDQYLFTTRDYFNKSVCGCGDDLSDFLADRIRNSSGLDKAALAQDFKSNPELLKAMSDESELVDLWKFYRSSSLDILKIVKKLKYAKQTYKVTDGVAFEDDLEKILIDLKANYNRGRKVTPNSIDNGGELDFELDNLLIEQTIGDGSKLSQIKKYIANPSAFNPKNNPIVLFGPRYTNANAVRDIQSLQAGGQNVRVINNFEDLLILLK